MSVLSDALQRLLDSPGLLMHSDLTPNQRKELEIFAHSTKHIEIVKQGRSTLYRIVNRHALLCYIKQLHPLSETELPDDLPARGRNIGLNRSSKQGKTRHDAYYLLMKSWADGVVWRNRQYTLEVSPATEQLGAAVLRINTAQTWRCNRPLLFVENQALFDRCNWMSDDFDGCLVYYAGQIADTLLQWLSEVPRTEHIILFPDYDGIGLANFARLAGSLHPDTRLSFYWLPDWRNKLITFGDPAIWANTRIQFENAIAKLEALDLVDDDFEDLFRLCRLHGKALEQESVWL